MLLLGCVTCTLTHIIGTRNNLQETPKIPKGEIFSRFVNPKLWRKKASPCFLSQPVVHRQSGYEVHIICLVHNIFWHTKLCWRSLGSKSTSLEDKLNLGTCFWDSMETFHEGLKETHFAGVPKMHIDSINCGWFSAHFGWPTVLIWLRWQFLGSKWFYRRAAPIDVKSGWAENLCGLSIVDWMN